MELSTTFCAKIYPCVDVKGDWLTGELTSAVLKGVGILKEATYDPTIKFDMGVPKTDTEQMFCGTLFCKETRAKLGCCNLDEAASQRKQDVWCMWYLGATPLTLFIRIEASKAPKIYLFLPRETVKLKVSLFVLGRGR
jgi:hypothetical protein